MLRRGYEVYVGKLDDFEINFICYWGREKLYIQVTFLLTPTDAEREFGNLEKIPDNYPKYVVSRDLPDLSRNGIIHKNIIKFLLEGGGYALTVRLPEDSGQLQNPVTRSSRIPWPQFLSIKTFPDIHPRPIPGLCAGWGVSLIGM